MLIFDSKQGRFGTQKPKQWGPLSAVRSAVFRNADAMGIDPFSIISYWPMWEGAGSPVYDVADSNHGTLNYGTWAPKGIIFGKSSLPLELTSEIAFPNTASFTIFTDIKTPAADSYRMLMGADDADNYIATLPGGGGIRTQDNNNLNLEETSCTFTEGEDVTISFSVVGTNAAVPNTYRYQIGRETYATHSTSAGGATRLKIGMIGNGYTDANYGFDSSVYSAFIIGSELNQTQVAQLHESPYLLLQPNPTPLIFDWGATAPSGWAHKIFGITPTKVYGVEPTKVTGV